MAIAELVINDKEKKEKESFQGQKIPLEAADLTQGWNTVMLRYFSPYNKNRTGLHSFIDAKDNNQYLYSQFEVYHCFKVFPCFDQPSLKAPMQLTVLCPAEWTAVSNSVEKKYDYSDGKKGQHILEKHAIADFVDFYGEDAKISIYDFEQTPKISPYLYAIVAGPYHVVEDEDPLHVPQRLFVRQSLKENARDKFMFGVTKGTIDFFQKSYGQRYPFSKVDHVLAPDYKYGAMENVGCITYNDGRLGAKELSVPLMTWYVTVIQHELCHMWFGNLVTMQWWNDLWLNEAFATCLAYYACAEGAGGEEAKAYVAEAWLHMCSYKRWGLSEDLLPSHHKIQADCPNSGMAESLIDGITYGKGCSMIKQLIFLLDWDTFCAGLKIYFRRHKWGNTTLTDFIRCM